MPLVFFFLGKGVRGGVLLLPKQLIDEVKQTDSCFILKRQNNLFLIICVLFLFPAEGTSSTTFNSENSPSTDGHTDGS